MIVPIIAVFVFTAVFFGIAGLEVGARRGEKFGRELEAIKAGGEIGAAYWKGWDVGYKDGYAKAKTEAAVAIEKAIDKAKAKAKAKKGK